MSLRPLGLLSLSVLPVGPSGHLLTAQQEAQMEGLLAYHAHLREVRVALLAKRADPLVAL